MLNINAESNYLTVNLNLTADNLQLLLSKDCVFTILSNSESWLIAYITLTIKPPRIAHYYQKRLAND